MFIFTHISLNLLNILTSRHEVEESETYYIEFTFDADVKCAVNIHYLATEDLSTGHAV